MNKVKEFNVKSIFSKKLLLITLVLFAGLLIISGCGESEEVKVDDVVEADEKTSFSIGCMPLNEPAVELLKELMAPMGYDVEVVVFDGNHLPAVALTEGAIDSLILNHLPWINTFNEEHDTELTMLEPYTYASIFGLYSSEFDSIEELPENAELIISGDPTNMDRSLRLLREVELITLGEKTGHFYSLIDVEENPLNLQLIEAETTATATAFHDVDAVVSFTSVMKNAGHDPNAYIVQDGEHVNFPTGLVVNKEDVDAEWALKAVEVTQSEEFVNEFNEIYQGAYRLFSEMDN